MVFFVVFFCVFFCGFFFSVFFSKIYILPRFYPRGWENGVSRPDVGGLHGWARAYKEMLKTIKNLNGNITPQEVAHACSPSLGAPVH